MAVTDWSTSAASNVTVGGVDIGENCSPAGINNALREIMAQVASGIDNGDFATVSGLQAEDATLTALAGVTTAANKLIYATGSDAFATTDLTAYARTLLALADAAALKAALGVVTIIDSTLSASGHISFDINGDGAADFKVCWGTGTWGGSTSFESAFSTACWVVIPITTSLIGQSDEADEFLYLSSKSVSGFTTAISGDYSAAPSLAYIALGK